MTDDPKKPNDEELAAYALGRLSEEKCVWIESYLESNPESEQRWSEIVVEDPFLNRIRERANQSSSSAAQANKVLPSGSNVGRYVLREVLGRGGMGVVYLAHDPVIHRDVAVKVIDSDDEAASDHALSEVRAQGRLSHSNIVTVYDADHCQHGVFIAMEVMARSLEQVLQDSGPQSVGNAFRFLLAACDGLQAAHAAGLVHRDIKPANLLLTSDGKLKLGDFGLAQTLDCRTITSHAPLAGTPHFMSPEQCRSEKVDVRSDVYALGATLYTLLTGEKPYSDSESALQVLYAHCQSAPPNLGASRQDLPEYCTDIVNRAMAKRPEDRFADAAEFADALRSQATAVPSSEFAKADSSQVWKQLASVPTGPSLVVLPFENLSGDPEQEYFSDGITQEIISQLGRFGELNLIAGRNAFQYKHKPTDLQHLRNELGVQYALKGAVRKCRNKIRISANLLNTETASILWTQSFDKDLSLQDVIEIQDEVAQNVASALAQPYGQLQVAEGSLRHQGAKINAYDAILKFYEYWRTETLDSYWTVRKELEKTVQTNPQYAQASAALSLLYVNGYRVHQLETGWTDLEKAKVLAKQSLSLNPNCEMAHQALISVYFHRNETESFALAAETAVSLYPSHADLLADVGLFFVCLGKYLRGMALAEKALVLSPSPPGWYRAAGIVYAFHNRDYQEALNHTDAFGEGEFWNHLHRAVAFGHLDRLDEAREEVYKTIDIFPDLVGKFRETLAKFNVTDEIARCYVEGLQRAGFEIA